MKKYYLLDTTDKHTLHVFDAPEQRDTETIAIIYSRQITPPQGDWETIKQTLTETGAFIAGEISIGWFEATPAKQDALAIILEKLNRIPPTVTVTNRAERALVEFIPHSPPEPIHLNDEQSLRVAEAVVAAQPVRVPISGGITLESDGVPGGIFKLTLNGKTLAATKPGGQFLVLADDATEGTWLIAAQHTLNAIKQ